MRREARPPERQAFVSTPLVALLATLSVTTTCAGTVAALHTMAVDAMALRLLP